MSLTYHQKSLEILGVKPKISQSQVALICSFEERYALRLPAALREWYSLENGFELLQEISAFHVPLEINNMPSIQKDYSDIFSVYEPLPILVENQWVWHMAVRLQEGENPPVYIRYNEPNENWVLHANSFTEWIHALSWDYVSFSKLSFAAMNERIISVTPETHERLFGFQVVAPETYVGNVYFKGEKLVRMRKNDINFLVIYRNTVVQFNN